MVGTRIVAGVACSWFHFYNVGSCAYLPNWNSYARQQGQLQSTCKVVYDEGIIFHQSTNNRPLQFVSFSSTTEMFRRKQFLVSFLLSVCQLMGIPGPLKKNAIYPQLAGNGI